jgi:hypothetical protein
MSGKPRGRKNRRNKPEPLPWVATGCVRRCMVRRGSTVRVPSEGFAGNLCKAAHREVYLIETDGRARVDGNRKCQLAPEASAKTVPRTSANPHFSPLNHAGLRGPKVPGWTPWCSKSPNCNLGRGQRQSAVVFQRLAFVRGTRAVEPRSASVLASILAARSSGFGWSESPDRVIATGLPNERLQFGD